MGEPRALLEGRTGFPNQRGLVDADASQGLANGRESALAHPENTDLGGLDQGDLNAAGRLRAQGSSQVTRRQPAGRPAADDQYSLVHEPPPERKSRPSAGERTGRRA
jgi:hypothetical protein